MPVMRGKYRIEIIDIFIGAGPYDFYDKFEGRYWKRYAINLVLYRGLYSISGQINPFHFRNPFQFWQKKRIPYQKPRSTEAHESASSEFMVLEPQKQGHKLRPKSEGTGKIQSLDQ